MIIIGLLGKAGSGKTSVAKYLQLKGFRIISFAGPIKELAREYFGLTAEEVYETKPPHARTILQGIGSLIREQIDENYFIQEAANKIRYADLQAQLFCIDDVRLMAEAQFIKDLGGIVVKIECPDSPCALTEQAQAHITEQIDLIIPYDHLISAEYGNVERLYNGIEDILSSETAS